MIDQCQTTPPAHVLAHPEERELWSLVATTLEPRVRMRPSEWAEMHVVLEAKGSARPGPFSCDWKPWTRDVHDAHYDNPGKLGVVGVKPEQVGWSRATINIIGCLCDTDPGPTLYITTDQNKALNFATREFDPMVQAVPSLRRSFEMGAKQDRELLGSKPFLGGVVDFVGAGTESGVISIARKWVVNDEFQLCAENFPAASGDLWDTATGRTKTYRQVGQGGVFAFGHPRFDGEDIMLLFNTLSDMRVWAFDCPHCSAVVLPFAERLRFGGLDADKTSEGVVERDPEQAVFACGSCGAVITDAQRARALWPPRLGGTGRFHCTLDAEEAARRPYVGLWVLGLADPAKTVREFATEMVAAKTPEKQQTFYNKRAGQPYKRSQAVITEASIERIFAERRERHGGMVVVPGGESGVRMLVTGCDVQAPRMNPTHYVVSIAYAANGMAYLTSADRVSGFTAYQLYLRRLGVAVDQGNGRMEVAGVRLATRDAGWETKQVLEDTRSTVYSEHGTGRVAQLAVKYVPHLHADNPAVEAPETKRRHPTMLELGLVDYWYLHRHSWVDRAIRRVVEGRLVVVCDVPADFKEHLMANILRPVSKQHGQDREQVEWYKPDELRDDWLQAIAYAEAGAALTMSLDRIHAIFLAGQQSVEGPASQAQAPQRRTAGWMKRWR
ncbi:MAG: hypothetical protein AMXMBFR58_29570 [Phycisphaerae bacterium]